MDLAHECRGPGPRGRRTEVSILVLMDLAHEYTQREQKDYASMMVSILVLMDLAHEYIFLQIEI